MGRKKQPENGKKEPQGTPEKSSEEAAGDSLDAPAVPGGAETPSERPSAEEKAAARRAERDQRDAEAVVTPRYNRRGVDDFEDDDFEDDEESDDEESDDEPAPDEVRNKLPHKFQQERYDKVLPQLEGLGVKREVARAALGDPLALLDTDVANRLANAGVEAAKILRTALKVR